MYIAHVVPGLEGIAAREIRALPAGTRLARTVKRFDERTSLLLLDYDGATRDLLTLRSVEDVFALAVQSEEVPAARLGLDMIRSTIAGAQSLDAAVTTALQVRPRRRGKPSFRVVARKAGRHAYRRVDVQRAAERALLDRFPRWRLVEDDAQLEVWVSLVGALLVVGVRLSDISMRQRTPDAGRRVELPASLKPTIAYAMIALSRPRDDDVFLDPMCGSGTILIERAQTARYRLLLGGDLDAQAVQATRDNIGPRYKPIEIRRWDATSLPLDDASVCALVTNMPFGRQIGTGEDNRTLYPALVAEWARVVRPGGVMVLLTSERTLLRQALGRRRELVLEQEVPVLVRGLSAAIHVVTKTASTGRNPGGGRSL